MAYNAVLGMFVHRIYTNYTPLSNFNMQTRIKGGALSYQAQKPENGKVN